jgi:hypothetical protein
MDVSILIGAVIAQFNQLGGDDSHSDDAAKLVRYVANQQTDQNAWFYTDPPGDSHIRHDNYHTGFILDALWRYMEASGDDRYQDAYWKGLDFYAQQLFNDNGSPRWMSDCDYPHDIHGAAQGILTFARHSDKYPDLASRTCNWAIQNMYTPGRFYYQQTPLLTKRFTLLRWCNAWMTRALATMYRHRIIEKK